ncbi:polyhydroxyalkanoate biosynthesis repressor PhaR [Neobacillus sp. NRS-1170]|uniref:polyhydroxyalkanoate biosynthesis repressor PhaR n=1 Tax=Neobacillus sp. NRS-1170 TaxID=3233898 RepID=UPI003D27D709
MPENKTYDPYDMFTKFSTQWEKQLNELFRTGTNNRDFLRFARISSDSNTLYQEMFKKYQETVESQFNLPTKNDLVNIAKLSIQTEEKLDLMEEEIWKLQDSFHSSSKEIEGIGKVSRDIINLAKELKTDISKTKIDQAEIKELHSEFQEIKKGLADLKVLKEEISKLPEILAVNKNKKNQQKKELQLTNSTKK